MSRKAKNTPRRRPTPAVAARTLASLPQPQDSTKSDAVQPAAWWRHDWVLALLLVAATVVVYLPALHGTPIWDDDAHLTRQSLRSLEGLSRIWTQPGATQQYYPLLHTFFWVGYHLWGDWPVGYHLLNICLHSASALLLVSVLRRLEIRGAWLAAAIFALHPIQTESVAWISELKNALSGVFYLGSLVVYLQFDRTRRLPPYLVALALFALGLMSKTVVATLPAALLVIFWWKRGTLSWRRDVLPAVPFFVVGTAAGMFTAWVERKLIGAEGVEFDFPILERVLIAGRVVWFYLDKLFWPTELTFVYPRWQVSQAVWWQYLFPAAVLLALVALGWLSRRWRGPLAGMLIFIGTLVPVLGFMNVYPFRYSLVADHFTYLANLGVIVPVAAGMALLLERRHLWRRPAGDALCAGLLVTLSILTWRQSAMYTDAETVWRTTIERNRTAWMAHNNLGAILLRKGQLKDAMAHFRKALELKADHAGAQANLGDALLQEGRLDEAIAHYQTALEIKPDDAEVHFNVGNALLQQGQVDEAIAHYQKALALNPKLADAHNNLGIVLLQTGHPDQAIAHYQAALEINPGDVKAQTNLAWALAISPETPILKGAIAVKLAQQANQLTGGANPMVLRVLAAAYAQSGRFAEALETARRSLQIATAQNNPALAGSLQMEVERYEKGYPYRSGDYSP